jgi:hypothetical protein
MFEDVIMEQLEFDFKCLERSTEGESNLWDIFESRLKEIDKAFGSFSLKPSFEQLELSL